MLKGDQPLKLPVLEGSTDGKTPGYALHKMLFANSAWLIASRLTVAGVNFLVLALVSRHLGTADFGLLSYAFSLATLLSVLGNLGLDGLVVRELVRDKSNAHYILGTMFSMRLAGYSIGAALLLLFGLFQHENSNASLQLIVCASVYVLLTSFESIGLWFNANIQSQYIAIPNMSVALLGAGVKAALVAAGAGVTAFALANVADVALMGIFMLAFFYLSSATPLRAWRFQSSIAQRLLAESWMIYLGTVFAIINMKIDQVMLKWLVGPSEVGVYAVAATLSEVSSFVPAAIVSSMLPVMVDLRRASFQQFAIQFQRLVDLLAILGLLLAVTTVLFGEYVIDACFGAQYLPASGILLIHIWSAPFLFVRLALGQWIIVERLPKVALVTQVSGGVVNIALNALLIPEYGGKGAAVATVISYATASYISLALMPETRSLFCIVTRSFVMPWRGGLQLAQVFARVYHGSTPPKK